MKDSDSILPFTLLIFLENPFVHQIRKWAATIAGIQWQKWFCAIFLFCLIFALVSVHHEILFELENLKLSVISLLIMIHFFFRYYAVGETMVSTKEELAIAQESLIEVVGAFFFWVSVAKQDGMGVGFLHSVISQETLHHLLTEKMQIKNRSRLGHFLFPALQAAHLFLVWVLIGSWWYFPWS